MKNVTVLIDLLSYESFIAFSIVVLKSSNKPKMSKSCLGSRSRLIIAQIHNELILLIMKKSSDRFNKIKTNVFVLLKARLNVLYFKFYNI